MDAGLLLLRVTLGLVMAAHGGQKLFGWFGGPGIAGTGRWLESMGFRPGPIQARLVGLSEWVGGLLLVLGLLTPLAAAAIMGVMIVAIAAVHLPKGFFNTSGGYELNLMLLVPAAALAFTGAGRFSLDAAMNLGMRGIAWGILAISAAVIGAGIALATRAPVPAAQEAETVSDERLAA